MLEPIDSVTDLPRVLFLRNSRGIADISGAETYLITLMRGLITAGCPVDLVCSIDSRRGRPLWLDRLEADGLPHRLVDVTSMTSLSDLRVGAGAVDEFGPDVLHAMDHRSDAIAVALGRRAGLPAVASFFGWTNFADSSLRGRLYPVIDRVLMRRLSRVIVDSRFVGRRTGLPENRVVVIPNGVDMTRFDPTQVRGDFRQQWFGRDDVTVVGAIGRVHPNKGHLELARAAARLCPALPELRFVVLGAPPPGHEDYAAALQAEIAAQGLAGRFLVTNVASADIPRALASFDVTALPSNMESLSYVMLESMAMNRPVVSADVGGHAEVIEDGESGFLVPAGDVAALADRIGRLAGDPALRVRMGAAGRVRVQQGWSIEAMVARTLAVYDEVRCR